MEQGDRIIMVYIKVDEAYQAITKGEALRRRRFSPINLTENCSFLISSSSFKSWESVWQTML